MAFEVQGTVMCVKCGSNTDLLTLNRILDDGYEEVTFIYCSDCVDDMREKGWVED